MVIVSNYPHEVDQPARMEKSQDFTGCDQNGPYCSDIASSLPTDVLQQKSPKKVLELLNKGVKDQNIAIIKQCIFNLDQRLDQTNVLTILTSLSKYTTSTNNNYEPSAPSLDESSDWLQDLIQNLRYNCLLLIDKHADFVLRQPEIFQLNYNDLLCIIERDTLQVSNESLVYVTIYKWAVEECHRRNLDDSDLNNLLHVLQRLQYCPRYGLFSKYKFTSKIIEGIPGPTRSGILEEKDWRLIKFYIEDKAKNRPVKDLPHKWSLARNICKNNPRRLSPTCSSSNDSVQKRTACEKCIINFLSCWTAVFD